MRGRVCAILLLVMALGSAGIVSAQPTRRLAIIQLDPIKTRINFTLPGAVHTTTGSFKLKHGEIRVDPETGGASGSIIVDAASASSGVAMRDSRMKNDILEVQRYPEISFAPRLAVGRPVPRGDFPMQVRGLFLLHGEPHNMMLDVAIRRKGDDFTAAAHFVVPYVKWGLKNPSLLFLTVSDEVAIDVRATGHVIWAPAQ
jgi:polyisoprenoid-binding protein YceI